MKKGRAAIIVAVSAALLVPFSVSSLVRREIGRKAADAGATVEYDSMSLSSKGVLLSGVRISKKRTTTSLNSVLLGVNMRLELTGVEARGGWVKTALDGEGGKKRSPGGVDVTLSDVSVELEGLGKADGVRMERKRDGAIVGSAKSVRVGNGRAEVEASGLTGRYESGKLTAEVEEAAVELKDREGGGGLPASRGEKREVEVEVKKLTVSVGGHTVTAEGVKATRKDGMDEARAKLATIDDRFSVVNVYGGVERNGEAVHVVASADSLKTSNPALTDKEISTGIIGCDLKETDGPVQRVEGTFSLGGASVGVNASTDRKRVWISVSLPESRCQDLLESAPPVMVEKLVPGTSLTGSIAADLQVDFDLPNREKPEARIRLKNGCRIQEVPQQFRVSLLKKPFKRTVYDPGRKPREEVAGPGSAEWRSLDMISRFLPLAVKTTEDPGFWAHRGFDIRAMENSIVDDVRSGRFSRGASTITMQLAKNLWLYRQKTLSRKLQELVLTTYLEQSLTKEEILELYLNVVELGPNVYGIGEASEHYFGTVSSGLSLSQSVFIASVLPNPNESFFGQDNRLRPGRLAFVRRIIQLMLERHLITKEEFDEGMTEIPVLDSPKPALEGEEVLKRVSGISPSDWN